MYHQLPDAPPPPDDPPPPEKLDPPLLQPLLPDPPDEKVNPPIDALPLVFRLLVAFLYHFDFLSMSFRTGKAIR